MKNDKLRHSYIVAHFSDFHIDSSYEVDTALEMVGNAVGRGADHIMITGDLLARANMRYAESFWKGLRKMRWSGAERCTFVPGNHDVFAVADGFVESRPRALLKSLPALVKWPSFNREKLGRLTKSCRKGSFASALCSDDTFAVGKVLAGGRVVIAGVDTTFRGSAKVWNLQTGRLPQSTRDGIAGFFGRHARATHRLLAMHHSPFEEDIHGGLEQQFVDPPPHEVMNWLASSGATCVCCGHIHQIHSIKKTKLSNGCFILRAGTAGGMHGDKRAYHLIDLRPDGKAIARRITVGW